MAGSLCPIEVMNRVISEMNMVDVAICYGMTETSPVSTMTRKGDTLRTAHRDRGPDHAAAGKPDRGPGHGGGAGRGQIGELCTRGYAVMWG